MYKKIRKKVASTVSGFEKSEDFAWGKWLKPPILEQHSIEDFESSFLDTDEYNSWLEKPAFQTKKFDFKETYIFPEYENLRPKKSKTHTVFFGLPKTQLKKLKLFDNEFKFDNKSEKIEFNNFGLKLKEVKYKLPQIEIEIVSWELKPDILKIDLLNSENLSVNKYPGKESKIEFKPVKAPPKIYKVKITSLDKIKLTKIYYLKNISLHDVRIVQEALSLLGKPDVQQEDLKYFINTGEKKQDFLTEKPLTADINTAETDKLLEIINEFADKSIEDQMSEIMPKNLFDDDNEIIEKELSEEIKSDEKIEIPDPGELIYEVKTEEIIDQPVEIKSEDYEPEPEPEEQEEPEEDAGDDYEPELKTLYNFQQEGAKFLLENKRAVLVDEMGLGKTIQVISAVKNHFNNNKIKSAVIVCKPSEIGSWGKIPGEVDGWLGHFHQRASEMKAEAAKGTPQTRKKQWKNLPDILVISYDSFFFDFEENMIDSKEINKNVCFVFDEVQNLLEHKKFNMQKFSASLNPKYLWITSSYPKVYVKEKLDNVFKEKLSNNNYLGRTRKEVEVDLPAITWQNKWLTLDEEQVEEYNEAFATAKEKVQWFLESGNPLRFNANVFTLIHQLKQVYNFSEKKGKSRKTRILLEQVSLIAKNQQKVVIFSQYEKAGTKKIEEVLKVNNIKFLSYAPGMSTKEMETVLKKFSSSSTITALVVGVKPSRVKIPSGNVSYVIHFDIWWNPASLWQTEESVIGSSKDEEKQSLTVYSYLTKDTVEERIHSLLHRKGFLNKHIMETVNPDSITEMITNPEWLEIFDMPDAEYKQRYMKGLLETEKRIDNYSTNEFIEKGKNFFSKLGYKNLNASESKTGEIFDIRGIYKKVKYDQQMCARFLLKNSVSEDEVKLNLEDLKKITNNGKYFLVTKGTFEGEEVIRSNDALIDRNLLANYFYQFIII